PPSRSRSPQSPARHSCRGGRAPVSRRGPRTPRCRFRAVARRREWTRETLAAAVRTGDRRALARAISLVENGDELAYDLVRDLYPATGHAYAVGVTGPPGVGKSSLISTPVRLVLMPGSGDSVQALKAGIMEIPDVIAINKLDHPAAKTMLNEVRSILALDRERTWKPPIVLTEAMRSEGIETLWEKIEEHRAFLEAGGELESRRRKNLAGEVFAVASARAKQYLEDAVADDPELRRLLDEVQARELDPLSAVREILLRVFKVEANGAHGR